METRSFQAETAELLNLVVNSIYSHKEIFLRELISNASDALDKLRFKSLTDSSIISNDSELKIKIDADKERGTVTISDNGIGMTKEEIIENLGTIAKSGTKQFFKKLEESKDRDVDLIGQFGVGFYSAFMVSDKVVVKTKSPLSDKGVKWVCDGSNSYEIEETEKEERGTEITLWLKKDEEDKPSSYLQQHTLQSLVSKYSDYVRYPIVMDIEVEIPEEKDKDGKVTTEASKKMETKTLNSMKPIWQKSKNEVTEEEYKDFYKQEFKAWDEPLDIIHTKAEGKFEYTSLIYIPSKAPFEFYSSNYERGLKLYSKQVFIMDKCADLVPEYLGFVKGLVDSADFSLNISREILQHDRQLKTIAKNIEKKILDSLKYMLKSEREKYEQFWAEFGKAIKAGIYSDFAVNKEKLEDLLLFESSKENKLTTLAEYVERMPETQKEIYYAAGKDRAKIEKMPQMELLREKDIEVLYFYDRIDEFATMSLREYKEKPLKSIASDEISISSEEEKKELKEKKEKLEADNKSLFDSMKEVLKGKIDNVRISERLKKSPVCIVSGHEGLTLNMEQVLNEAGQNMMGTKAERILEINPDHKIFEVIKKLHDDENSKAKFENYCEILYGQAMIIEGLMLDNPSEFAEKISNLMSAE